jgi:hypothetical protein
VYFFGQLAYLYLKFATYVNAGVTFIIARMRPFYLTLKRDVTLLDTDTRCRYPNFNKCETDYASGGCTPMRASFSEVKER